MKLSYVIVTHNRRDALLATLRHLHAITPLAEHDWEAWVVDNASTDGSAQAVRGAYPHVNIIERTENEGAGARTHAFAPARGQYLILLDDDSYPAAATTVSRSIAYMDTFARCAAVTGPAILPDGFAEACAMPGVLLSGACCVRRDVMIQVGSFRTEFFRKAGEYDLSYRVWDAGYRIERFEDIVYRHDKHPGGRVSSFAHRMDLRNNLILVERYLPRAMRSAYRADWLRRYAMIAEHAGERGAADQAIVEARQWASMERITGRQTLRPATIETLFEWDAQARAVAEWSRRHGIRTVAIADHAKNIYATWRACRDAGLQIAAVADDHPAFADRTYRGVAILPTQRATSLRGIDGIVIAQQHPYLLQRRVAALRSATALPLLTLHRPRTMTEALATTAAA